MPRGIMEMLSSVGTLLFALPVALAGVELLLRGNLLVGVGLFSVALAMIAVEQYIDTPSDLPGLAASKLVEAVLRLPDEE